MKPRPRRMPTRARAAIDLPDRPAAGSVPVQVLDVHAHGARIAAKVDLQPGERCALRVLAIPAPGTIRWAAGGMAGIAFDGPLPARQVEALRRSA